jgi:hypothetical protein
MYIKLTDGVPERYTLRQLRKDNPNVSFPAEPPLALLESWDVWPYVKAPIPAFDPATQTYDEFPMVRTAGVYSESYAVRDKTQAELDVDAVEATEREAEQVQSIKDDFDYQYSVSKVMLKVSFLQENRIRALEGKQPVTAAQFRAWVENQIE